MYNNIQDIQALEQQYQQRKTMTPREIAITWKDLSCSQILFSEFCFYNLEKFKGVNDEVIPTDDFLMTMKHMCFEEELPSDRPDSYYHYWSKPSSRACQRAISLRNDSSLDDEVRLKLKEYIAFHDANKIKMLLATKLMADYAFEIQPLAKSLKPRMKNKFQKAEEFQNTIVFALKRLAFAYAGQIKDSFNEPFEVIKIDNINNPSSLEEDDFYDFTNNAEYFVDLDKDKILNPPILEPFKKDKIVYLQTLSAWFTDALEHHRESTMQEKLPMAYQKAMVFLEDIKQTIEQTNKDTQKEGSNKTLKGKSNSTQKTSSSAEKNYPKSIFENHEAYQLFCAWMKKATTKKQVEFIYRHMSERENPPLILVKDTPFRNWYNAQEIYTIKLDTYTTTYQISTNEDRLLAYELLKEIFKKPL